jgi:hypothetical protein
MDRSNRSGRYDVYPPLHKMPEPVPSWQTVQCSSVDSAGYVMSMGTELLAAIMADGEGAKQRDRRACMLCASRGSAWHSPVDSL